MTVPFGGVGGCQCEHQLRVFPFGTLIFTNVDFYLKLLLSMVPLTG